jgi:hypothetical protein
LAKNRRRKSKKKARYRQQRPPERRPVELLHIENVRTQWVRRILASVGVEPDGFHHLEFERVSRGVSWDGLVAHLVMEHAPEAMVVAVEDYLDPSGLALEATPSRVGIMLHRRGAADAVVHPTYARLFGGSIRGDFTADGPHWAMLRTALLERRLPRPEKPVVATNANVKQLGDDRRTFTVFPPCVREDFLDRVIEASKRIRTERSLDYGTHSVVLEASDHLVRYEAITRRGDAVELPFSFTQLGQDEIRGALWLRCAEDPLVFVCSHELGDELLALVWGSALIGFAELTCVPETDTLDNELFSQRDRRAGTRGRSSDERRYLVSGGNGGFGHASPTIRPTGRTAEALASYVAGHRRRLSDTAQASDAQRAAAADIGIVLRPHETWVRPHVRGVPTGAELHFRWESPVSLAA